MRKELRIAAMLALAIPAAASAYLQFGAELLVQDGGEAIEVIGY